MPNSCTSSLAIDSSCVYCSLFSPSGALFLAATQRSIACYDSSDPCSLRLRNIHPVENVCWTISDIDVNEQLGMVAYTTMNPTLNLLNLESGHVTSCCLQRVSREQLYENPNSSNH